MAQIIQLAINFSTAADQGGGAIRNKDLYSDLGISQEQTEDEFEHLINPCRYCEFWGICSSDDCAQKLYDIDQNEDPIYEDFEVWKF